jgi:ADP-heptose:LPS heptosyltransferase
MMQSEPHPVVISPFANERLRQWPSQNYREFIEIIWRQHGLPSLIVGTREHRAQANDIVRGLSSMQAKNGCGCLSWDEILAVIDDAPYVVSNNSGVAHIAAARGRWTLCIFSASHAYTEWMPRGPFVITITRTLPCSPCSIASDRCPNDHACMVDLRPSEVFWRFDFARNKVLDMDPPPVEMLGDAR